jgi:two-component system OmpR family sensor kinase
MTVARLRRVGPLGRLTFVLDLAVVTLAALAEATVAGALDADARVLHLTVTTLTVAVCAGVAVVAVAGAGQRDRRFAWIGAAFGLYAVLCLPLAAIGPRSLSESPGLLVALVVSEIVVALLLLVAHWAPLGSAQCVPWAAAGVAIFAVLVVGWAGGREGPVGGALDAAAADAVAIAWVVAATMPLVAGLRARDCAMWRVGLGLSVIAAAQVYEAVGNGGFLAPSSTALGLQLVGAGGVLAAAVRRVRGEVSDLLNERDLQRAELREAAQHVERAAALARERDHELANGLAGLAGIAYLLDQPVEQVSGDAAALRSAVVAELARLHALLSSPPARPGAAPRSFDLTAVLTELTALRRAAGMRVELDADGPLLALGDRDATVQVVTNLLVNCERHAPGSNVVVRARRAGDLSACTTTAPVRPVRPRSPSSSAA